MEAVSRDNTSQARRRSVDAAPLSQTLVALKRVRSLRDPETNSMDKFSTFLQEVNDMPTPREPGSSDEEGQSPSSSASLSQKYRPRSFDELVGQPLVAQSLADAVFKRKISPIYLFHGPHGTGKSSAARIFAAALTTHVEELDPARLNSRDKIKDLIKRLSPIRSSYRVFIVDECHDLHVDVLTAIVNAAQLLSCSQLVFIMITSDLEKLPRVSLSGGCQRYHFPRIKDADIVRKLREICEAEGFDFEDEALTFAAARSNGSLREAETMLDQLSLLGKRITLSLARELAGVVSEEELLELLDVALARDAPNVVRRARELLSSKVDPMQLISQLANLIMDILAGRCRAENPAGRMFESGDVGLLHKLRNALRVLSETEKQLRASKSRATWLTVALLQLNAQDSDYSASASTLTFKRADDDDDDDDDLPPWARESDRKLDAVWRRTIELCHSQSDRSRSFLKKGRLTSIYLKQGLAVAQVEFSSPENAARAEASWKLINSSLQRILCHEAELRISLARRRSSLSKVKELTLRLLGCSLGKRPQYTLNRSASEKCCGMDSRVISPGEERLSRLAKLQRRNTLSPGGRPGSSLLPSRRASPEAFLCDRVPFVFCARRRHQPS